MRLFDYIHRGYDPYAQIETTQIADDCRGWGSADPFWLGLIEATRPSTILEIGSWKGASAIYIAQCCTALNLQTEIICVDPHVGSFGLWVYNREAMHITPSGECGTYQIMLANIIRTGLTHMITPFRATAIIAAKVMAHAGCQADIVFIDGSHDRHDVLGDLFHAASITQADGLIVLDDYGHERVCGPTEAVAEFLERQPEWCLVSVHDVPADTYTERILNEPRSQKAVLSRRQGRCASIQL